MSRANSLKWPLILLAVAVVFATLSGVKFVLANNSNSISTRPVFTAVIVAIASLCGLACDLSKMPLGLNLLPKAGSALTVVTAALLLGLLWGGIDSEIYYKITVCIVIVQFATVHVCLLSIAKLVGKYRWVYIIGSQVIFGLATILCAIVIFEINSPEIVRAVAAITILVAAITLIIPILHRLGKLNASKEELLMPIDARNVAVIDGQIFQLEKRIATLKRIKEKIAGEDSAESP